MNPEYRKYELIDRYLNKQLSVEESEQFDLTLSQDSELKELVEAQKLSNELIIDNQMLLLKERMQKDLGGEDGTKFDWKIPALISGLLVFSISGYYFYPQNKENTDGKITKNTTSQNAIILNNTEVSSPIEVPKKSKQTSTIPLAIKEDKKYSSEKEIKFVPLEPIVNERIVDFVNIVPEEKVTHLISELQKENSEKNIPAINCNNIKITAKATSIPTCAGKNEGAITIDMRSVKGGTAPYLFSIRKDQFSSKYHFDNLKSDTYFITIKDINNCLSVIEEPILIQEKSCPTIINDAFMPLNGETWKFPVQENANASIKITSKGGILVYSTLISGGYPTEWNGTGTTGAELEAGMYYFILEYTSGEQQHGYISIVK